MNIPRNKPKNKKSALLCGAILLSITLCAWGNTTYIFAKAILAQYLIEDAWDKSLQIGGIHKPWSWADTWPVARLQSPRLKKDLFVLSGASGTSLAFGPGHLDGSSQPGELGTIVIGGHRDTHFSFLQELKIGDELQLQNKKGTWFTYQVKETAVSDSRSDTLRYSPSKSELVLVTCYPFDSIVPGGPLRYVVHAELLTEDSNKNS